MDIWACKCHEYGKKLNRIKEVLAARNREEFGNFEAVMMIGRIVDPPKITEADMAWARKELAEILEEE
jgi:hypothetical protein